MLFQAKHYHIHSVYITSVHHGTMKGKAYITTSVRAAEGIHALSSQELSYPQCLHHKCTSWNDERRGLYNYFSACGNGKMVQNAMLAGDWSAMRGAFAAKNAFRSPGFTTMSLWICPC